ncbi:MAG: zinc ABC transporter substrate-binding protein [Terrimicrobiaceae bacterium]
MTTRLKHAAAIAALSLLGICGANARPLEILTSFYPMYVSALNVAGDVPGVDVVCLTPPIVGCLHDYQLTPGDMKKIAGADIFVANGVGMETFIDKALKQSPSLKLVDASKGIKLVGDNPHVWVSISAGIRQVKNIAAGLAKADPARAEQYKKNAAAYVVKLETLRDEMHAALDGLKNRDIITFHEAFPYFAAEFKLNIAGVIEREPGSEPGAKELADTVETVRKLDIRALFAEPQYPAKCAKVIERETGVPVNILDPAVSGPGDPSAARDSYLATMRKNLDVLRKALSE